MANNDKNFHKATKIGYSIRITANIIIMLNEYNK